MLEEGREWDVHVKTRAHKGRMGREEQVERIKIAREEARVRKEKKAQDNMKVKEDTNYLDGKDRPATMWTQN